MRFIFIYETNENSKVDEKYIRTVLNYKYDINRYVVKNIFMNGKTNIPTNKTLKKVNIIKDDNLTKEKYEVFVFSDVDRINDNQNFKIKAFCKENKYHLVWFNRDIEDVMIGKRINNKDKVKTAYTFSSSINENKIKKLNLNNPNSYNEVGSSNLYYEFNKVINNEA